MRKHIDVKLNNNIIRRINASRLSETDRQAAIDGLRDAERIVDACAWLAKNIEQFGARLFLKPSLKH